MWEQRSATKKPDSNEMGGNPEIYDVQKARRRKEKGVIPHEMLLMGQLDESRALKVDLSIWRSL